MDIEEQFALLSHYLLERNKELIPVEKDGLCILRSFKIQLERTGQTVTIEGLKSLLRSEILQNYDHYRGYSVQSVNVLKELDLFLKDPINHYVAETVDLFLMALARALCVEVTLFEINKEGEVAEMDVGVQEPSSLTLRIPRVLEPHRILRGVGPTPPLLSHNSLDVGT